MSRKNVEGSAGRSYTGWNSGAASMATLIGCRLFGANQDYKFLTQVVYPWGWMREAVTFP